jgi:triphosphoribosyl-dephospho-CoA synthase
MKPWPREELERAYREACEGELLAFKPGNVSVHSEGHGMTVEDFRQSAKVSAPFLCDPELSLGEKIFHAVSATRAAVGCNTNLGIVLLAAPLLESRLKGDPAKPLRESLKATLDRTTVGDAAWAYRAICLAAPGGLGESEDQDVREPPRVTLRQAMAIAAGRDAVARQYYNYYADIFDFSIPRYYTMRDLWDNEAWATVGVYAGLLGAFPDSHVERKFGVRFSRTIKDKMRLIERALASAEKPERTLRILRDVDAEFKSAGINPGATADLTATCLLAVRLGAAGIDEPRRSTNQAVG